MPSSGALLEEVQAEETIPIPLKILLVHLLKTYLDNRNAGPLKMCFKSTVRELVFDSLKRTGNRTFLVALHVFDSLKKESAHTSQYSVISK